MTMSNQNGTKKHDNVSGSQRTYRLEFQQQLVCVSCVTYGL